MSIRSTLAPSLIRLIQTCFLYFLGPAHSQRDPQIRASDMPPRKPMARIDTIAHLQPKRKKTPKRPSMHPSQNQTPPSIIHQQSPDSSPPQIRRLLLHPESSIRLPQLLHLCVGQSLIHLLHIHELLHGEDLTGDIGRYGVVDGAQTLVQA